MTPEQRYKAEECEHEWGFVVMSHPTVKEGTEMCQKCFAVKPQPAPSQVEEILKLHRDGIRFDDDTNVLLSHIDSLEAKLAKAKGKVEKIKILECQHPHPKRKYGYMCEWCVGHNAAINSVLAELEEKK